MRLGPRLGFSESNSGGVSPAFGWDFLTQSSVPSEITCDRNSVASYRDNTGKYKSASANVARLHHTPDGSRIGLINEVKRTRKNNYAFPESGVVGTHFTSGSSDITIVTNASSPLTTDYTNNDQVWRIDNSGGGGPVTYPLAGTVGNTNVHNIQCWHQVQSGAGFATLQIGGRHSIYGKCFLNSRTGCEVSATHIVPATTGDQLEITVPAGMIIDISVANAQEDLTVADRYSSHITTPILHGPGTQAVRDDEFLYIDAVDTLGYDDSVGTIIYHGNFLGAENTNSGALAVYDVSNSSEDFMYLRASPNGDWLWFGEGSNSTFVNATTPTSLKRRPTPLDIAFAFRWDSSGDNKLYYLGVNTITDSSTNTPQNVDRIAFYRHDSGARNDSTLIITKFELYNTAFSDAQLKSNSYRTYGYVDVTVSQSNIDRKMRGVVAGVPDNALTTGAMGSSTMTYNYPGHGISSPGGTVTITNATTFDGITAGQLNDTHDIHTIVDADNIQFDVASDTATVGSVSGGGTTLTAELFQDGDAGGPDFISTQFMEQYVPNYVVIRGPDYWDGATDNDYGGGALLKSTGAAGADYFVDDDDTENLADGLDLTKMINTLTENFDVLGQVNNFQIDLGPFEEGRTEAEINGIVKDGFDYLIGRLRTIGGANTRITFQMWTKRFATDDIITWTWREMLRTLVSENSDVKIIAEPYDQDLDDASNAHFATEMGYVNMYLNGQRKILDLDSIVDHGNVDNPVIASATFTDASADITLTFTTEHSATLSSGSLAILAQLFKVDVNDSEATISSVAVSGTTVTITMASALSTGNTVDISYPYRLIDYDQDSTDENDAGTAVLVDNSPWALPVAQFSDYSATEV